MGAVKPSSGDAQSEAKRGGKRASGRGSSQREALNILMSAQTVLEPPAGSRLLHTPAAPSGVRPL